MASYRCATCGEELKANSDEHLVRMVQKHSEDHGIEIPEPEARNAIMS